MTTWNDHALYAREAAEFMGLAPTPAVLAFDFLEPPAARRLRCRAPRPVPREAQRRTPPAAPTRPYSMFAGRALSAEERAFKRESDRLQREFDYLRPQDAPDDCRPGMPRGLRPCPWASCRHHLGVTVNESGSIKVDHGTLDFETLSDTCAIDVARRHPEGVSQEVAAEKTGVTKDRIRQVERALRARLLRKARRISTEWSPPEADGRETCVPCGGDAEVNGVECTNCEGEGYRWREAPAQRAASETDSAA